MGNAKSDEIDLLVLLLNGIRVIRDNFWLIISFFVVGTLLGFTYYSMSKKVYENRLLISSEVLTETYGKRLMEDINRVVFERNYKFLTTELGITEETAQGIAAIRIQSPLTNETEIAKEMERKFFHIIVDVYDQKILPDLQKGLLTYIENNEFVKTRVNQKKEALTKTIARLDQEIKDLEALKKDVYNGDFFKKATGYVNFDLTNMNKQLVEFTKERLKAQHDLELADNVHVVEGFTTFTRPTSPKLSLSLIAGSTVGLSFVGLLIAFKSIKALLAMSAEPS